MPTSQKLENLLNLALEATPREREESESLNVGFSQADKTWELILKYTGDLSQIAAQTDGIRIVELSGGYAIAWVAEALIPFLAAQPQIEYIEKPKRLFFSARQGRTASCMDALQITDAAGLKTDGQDTGNGTLGDHANVPLLGQGILAAVIDSGVDYTHPDFRNPDGTTRILAIWDQSARRENPGAPDSNTLRGIAGAADGQMPAYGRPPAGFPLGIEYTKTEIDEALQSGVSLPVRDFSGHGTEVLGIVAGNGRASLPGNAAGNDRTPLAGNDAENDRVPSVANAAGAYEFGPDRGVAPLADILVVKLAAPAEDGFPRTTELMMALEYTYRKAQEFGLPVAVNLSFGNVYGPHNGTGLLETYLAQTAQRWRSVVAVGTGNEGEAAGHTSGILSMRQTQTVAGAVAAPAGEPVDIELGISPFETTISVQLWKSYADRFEISLIHPTGQTLGPLPETLGAQRYRLGDTELLIFYGKPSPFSVSQEIYVDFLPAQGSAYIDNGLWRFRLTPRNMVDGRFDMWLPSAAALGSTTRFYYPSPDNTLTVPSTARNIIAVGAYNSRTLSYAPFSGRGNQTARPFPPGTFLQKPDLAAPGVAIRTTAPGGGYTTVTGTSFATPFVTGAAAMLMQWGIVNGNDPYLYGEKVRAYLIRGAQPLPGAQLAYPNNQVGYGTLCVSESLPKR